MNHKIRGIPVDEEPVEDALSNRVYITEDKVIKIYSRFPVTSLYPSILEIFNGRPKYVDRSLRMSREKEMKSKIRESGLKAPEILETGENHIVFEKVPGVSGYNYLKTCNSDEAEKFGETLRNFLKNLHETDTALRDCRISNFMVDEGEVYSIDHEYASTDAGKLFKFLDGLTVVSSARQTRNYRDFVKGFQPDKVTVSIAFFTAVFHNLLFERELSRLKNVFKSTRF